MTTEKKIIGGVAFLTILALVGGVVLFSRGSKTSVPREQLVSENGLHWHPRVTVMIKGKKQEIPANIGMSGNKHAEIHTHEQDAKDGVVHLEMRGAVTSDELRLGNFLHSWNKDLSVQNILNTINDPEGRVTMLVNGKENTEFDNYVMQDGDNIELRYE